jgi:thiosulfate/3-mercaptopyruvate sulfurtransferase
VVLVPGGRDHSDFNAIARVYWTFKVLGHDQVSILNGGDKAWFADRTAPVETGNGEQILARTFTAQLRPELLATREEVKQALDSKTVALVDARPQPQFEGKAKAPTVRVAGTLPGAVNAPATSLVAADGTRLVDQGTIRAILDKAGIKPKEEQISFCNTGHFAAGTWFVLHEVEGNSKAKLYAGSMSDWTGDPAAPVVAGTVSN